MVDKKRCTFYVVEHAVSRTREGDVSLSILFVVMLQAGLSNLASFKVTPYMVTY